MKPYVLQIDLNHLPCLVVGGGPIGLVKTKGLLDSGAIIRVVSRSFVPGFNALEGIDMNQREFESTDLDGMKLVHAATSDEALNDAIAAQCAQAGILCCVASDGALGTFAVPAYLDKGDIRITVGTNGASPSYGARLRRKIETVLPEDPQPYIESLRTMRDASKHTISDPSLRMRFNAYLASEVGEQEFSDAGRDAWLEWANELMADPESVDESYTPKWNRD
jgi:precorrin-2 dehydrogenase/sirohydrochlorin ferrochelatase